MEEKDYYEILQVSPNAEQEVIEAAYKRLARKYHPDHDKSPDAVQRMQEINEAYATLSNTNSRYFYDIDYRKRKQPSPQPTPPQPTPQPESSTPTETTSPKQKQPASVIEKAVIDLGIVSIIFGLPLLLILLVVSAITSKPASPNPPPLTVTRSSTSTPVAIATNTKAPTSSPTDTSRPTATIPTCISASQVTIRQVGDSLCIIGTVASIGKDNVAQYINFQDSDLQLVTYDPTLIIPFTAGACIQQRGQVQKLGNRPVILFDIRDAYYKCDAPPPSARSSPTAIVQAPAPTQPPNTNNTGQGQLTIINDTRRTFKFVFWGAVNKEVEVYSQPIILSLPIGAYGWTAFSNGCQLDAAPNLIINPTNTIQAVTDDSPCGWRVYWNTSLPIQPPQTSNNTINSPCPYGCDSPPSGCNIKGNISFDTGEKIYHVPGGMFYDSTTIDPRYGEKWFCTEQEATNNGWRKSSQ